MKFRPVVICRINRDEKEKAGHPRDGRSPVRGMASPVAPRAQVESNDGYYTISITSRSWWKDCSTLRLESGGGHLYAGRELGDFFRIVRCSFHGTSSRGQVWKPGTRLYGDTTAWLLHVTWSITSFFLVEITSPARFELACFGLKAQRCNYLSYGPGIGCNGKDISEDSFLH